MVYDEGFPAWAAKGYPVEQLHILPNVDIPEITGAKLKEKIASGERVVILDIRDDADMEKGRIAGSTDIELEDLQARFGELPREREIVLVDLHGKQTNIAGRFLLKQGFTRISRLQKGFVGGWLEQGDAVKK